MVFDAGVNEKPLENQTNQWYQNESQYQNGRGRFEVRRKRDAKCPSDRWEFANYGRWASFGKCYLYEPTAMMKSDMANFCQAQHPNATGMQFKETYDIWPIDRLLRGKYLQS